MATFAIATSGGDIIVKRDNCPIQSFALAHPHAARRVLLVPTFLTSRWDDNDGNGNNNPILNGESLESYIHWRKRNVMAILYNYPNLRNSHDAYTSAIVLLSHPLTFPLTRGRYFAAGRSRWNKQTTMTRRHRRGSGLRLCCLGARAECTVPGKYWREFLVAIASGRCGGRTGGSVEDDEVMAGVGETTTLECTIDFYLHTLITIH